MALPYAVNNNTNPQVYAASLASALSQIYFWDPAPGLAEDPAYYEKFLQDSVVAGACDKLQKLIVGHSWSHQPVGETPEDRKLAKILDELQRETETLPQTLYNLAAASWKGATWGEIRLTRRILRIGDGKPRVWTVIKEVKDADKRRFRLTRAAASPVTTDRTASELRALANRPADIEPAPYKGPLATRWRWEFNRGYGPSVNGSAWYAPLEATAPLDQWILHRVDTSERGLGYGYGLAEDLYFGVYAKGAVVKNLLQGIDRWGEGFLVQKIAGLRQGGPGGLTPEQKIEAVTTTLRTYRSQNVYAMDADDELELIDGPAEAIDACMRVIGYYDDCHTMRILAATRTSGGGEGGTFGQAKVEEGSEDANVAFLRSPLEERWTLTATRLLLKKNAHNLRDLGIPQFLATPRFTLRGRKTADPEKAATTLKTAFELGLPIVKRQAYDMLELDMPNPEDGPESILTPPQTQALLAQQQGGDATSGDGNGRQRSEMPQVVDHDAAMSHLKSQGVQVSPSERPLAELQSAQEDLNGAKVDRLVAQGSESIRKKPLLVSSDDWVLDGHHRHAALRALGDETAPVTVIGLPRDQALEALLSAPGVERRGIRGGAVKLSAPTSGKPVKKPEDAERKAPGEGHESTALDGGEAEARRVLQEQE